MWYVPGCEGAELVALKREKGHGVPVVADKFHLISHAIVTGG